MEGEVLNLDICAFKDMFTQHTWEFVQQKGKFTTSNIVGKTIAKRN